jgi:hypothetical protein
VGRFNSITAVAFWIDQKDVFDNKNMQVLNITIKYQSHCKCGKVLTSRNVKTREFGQ